MKKEPEESKEKSAEEIPAEVTLKKEELETMLKRIAELESLQDKMMRTAADFENAKKRLAKERDDFVKFAKEDILRSLLPVLDNFERALAHCAEVEGDKERGILTGIERVFKQMTEILKTHGLERLEALGQPYDPHLHEAIGHLHEEGEEDEIVEEVEPGYRLNGRLLRAAKVRVRTAPPSEKNAS